MLSTDISQEITGKVTAKELRKFLSKKPSKGWSTVFTALRAEKVAEQPSYTRAFVFYLSVTWRKGGDYNNEIREEIKLPGYVSFGNTSETAVAHSEHGPYTVYTEVYSPSHGFWSLYATDRALSDLLEVLPASAEVGFSVGLDHGTTEGMKQSEVHHHRGPSEKGLHGDHLYLLAKWKRGTKTFEKKFLLDTVTVPHNSARFGGGRA